MAVPEWFGSTAHDAAALATEKGTGTAGSAPVGAVGRQLPAHPVSCGVAAMEKCHDLVAVASVVLESCGSFFDPVVLA
ncbi:hypothetical protein ACX80E_09090, partial [Arthrobacter sp. TMN-49]